MKLTLTKLIVILLVGLFCEAVGVVCLSKGMKQIGGLKKVNVSEVLRIVKATFKNQNIILGMIFETAFFITLLIMMANGDVSFVWPLTSLSFVFTTVAAKFFLHETVSPIRWSGVVLIMIGAGVITYSEKVLEKKDAPPPVTQSDTGQ